MTFSGGILSMAATNYLLSELHYAPWIGGIIVSLSSLGFMIFTFFFGHLSDKHGQRKIIRIIMLSKFIFSGIYLIPITSLLSLLIFGLIFFLDGAISGLFWPTIQQISALAEIHGNSRIKQKFMSGYNFSWNLGYILGMFFFWGLYCISF
ncbi:MAG: MFS transporter [Promethearchaeota archaeon]